MHRTVQPSRAVRVKKKNVNARLSVGVLVKDFRPKGYGKPHRN